MSATAALGVRALYFYCSNIAKEASMKTTAINAAAPSEQVRERSSKPVRQLTGDELDQITGGIVPSIPIPPPMPDIYVF
jgi:hypothetical protein